MISKFRTSPVIRASEKSSLLFHRCVRNTIRNWRGLYFWRISCDVARKRGQQGLIRTHVNGDKVLQRFTHLEALDMQMTGVYEIIHPRPTVVKCLRRSETAVETRFQNKTLTSACAISLSWWGNAKSIPPEWISKFWPKIALAITEHSICQPGRPGPQGEGHEGSPVFDRFHRAKSEGDLRPMDVDRAPDHERC